MPERLTISFPLAMTSFSPTDVSVAFLAAPSPVKYRSRRQTSSLAHMLEGLASVSLPAAALWFEASPELRGRYGGWVEGCQWLWLHHVVSGMAVHVSLCHWPTSLNSGMEFASKPNLSVLFSNENENEMFTVLMILNVLLQLVSLRFKMCNTR